MDVLSLNPWLLLGALSLVILSVVVTVVVISIAIDRTLKALTHQLERDLQRIFEELDKTNFEIRLLKQLTLSESGESSDNPD